MPATFDEVCEQALALPCSPRLLPQLTEVLARHDADIEDLSKLIQLDPVLASSTLRLANSAFFGASAPVENVGDAVMRLGARELYRLAALSLAARWMAVEVDGYSWEAGDFCRASLVKAVAAEKLAEHTGLVDPSLAYTGGLVHDIGKLAIAFSCSDRLPSVRSHLAAMGGTWLEAETAVLGFNFSGVSGRLLTEWQFPALCIAAATHPDAEGLETTEERCMAAHLHAAQHLAAAFGAGQGEDAFHFTFNPILLEEFGLTSEVVESQLPDVHEQVARLLKDRVSVGPISV